MGFIFSGNRHLIHFWRLISIAIAGGEAGSTPPPSGNKLLTEGGDGILTESGDNIILET